MSGPHKKTPTLQPCPQEIQYRRHRMSHFRNPIACC
jgi:hypothetical protein